MRKAAATTGRAGKLKLLSDVNRRFVLEKLPTSMGR